MNKLIIQSIKLLKKTLLILLIVSLGTAGIRDFTKENYIHHNGSHICPISSSSEKKCPPADNSKFFIAGHISETKYVLQALLKNIPSTSGYFLVTLSILLILALSSPKLIFTHIYRFNRRFLRWITLHNKRDIDLQKIAI